MNRLMQRSVSVLALLTVLFTTTYTAQTQAQSCPFDDGNSSIEIEGLILTRYALGLTGAPLVANTVINAVDAPTVEATINCPSCGLNITGNPAMTVADATIISRKLAGFSGAALTDNLALGSGSRNTPAAVQSFLLSGCGATGGTVTSVAASAPLASSGGNTPVLSLTGLIPLANGGTGANLAATGGTGQYLKQTSIGGAVTVASVAASDVPEVTCRS